MDHLPLPQSPKYPPLEIPFLGLGYLGGDFLDYDQRQGITYADLFSTSSPSKRADRVASFFQSWLFFGLIDNVLDTSIPTETFLREDLSQNSEHRILLSTAKLPSLVLAWAQHEYAAQRRKGDERKRYESRRKHVFACLMKANDVIYRIVRPLSIEQYLSLMGIGEYLTAVSMVMDPSFDAKSVPLDRAPVTGISDIFSQRMRDSRWCPSQIAAVRAMGSVAALSFASQLKGVRGGEHRECTEFKCVDYQVDEHTYETLHARETCHGGDCHHMLACQKQMLDILRRSERSIPLIYFEENSLKVSEIKIQDSVTAGPYVAISHVWADGMGNNKSNSIWECQLRYLANAVNQLYPERQRPIPFWFDTLCFPLQPPEAYNLAMQKMHITYKFADKVLVVDGDIRGQNDSQFTHNECIMRIGRSRWMRRLWTLQEGILAKNLYFRFANSAFDIDLVRNRYFEDIWVSEQDQEWLDCIPLLWFASKLLREVRMELDDNLTRRLSNVAEGMARRSTSVSSDEPLCIATLLDLDMASILSVPITERMDQAWRLMADGNTIHPGALFAGVDKLETKGLRWAPKTLLRPDVPELYHVPESIGPVQLTNEGLLVRCAGFLLAFEQPMKNAFIFRDEEGWWYRAVSQYGERAHELVEFPGGDGHQMVNQYRSPSMAILYSDTGPLAESASTSSSAVLAIIQEIRADTIFVSFKSKIWIYRELSQKAALYDLVEDYMRGGNTQVMSRGPQAFPGISEERLDEDLESAVSRWCAASGQQTSYTQSWCVN
ncbi:hypothetical protein MMC10_000239 [Thelotrema lepadinum]|nr:hypothetical protein [Thelotrema lepadinum]